MSTNSAENFFMFDSLTRQFSHRLDLKYGCNPHQKPAGIFSLDDQSFPFEVLNGKPGYINLLDAMNAWQLVMELDNALAMPAATSFKHVSPAGAAVAVPLNDLVRQVYECPELDLSPLATAYIRARGADPMSSYGDFIALSRPVDLHTARIIKSAVSDGMIAPDYEAEALEILKAKKRGSYLLLKANPDYRPPELEYREVFGLGFAQKRNSIVLDETSLFQQIPTKNKKLNPSARRDLILAAITLKYTQSNSIGYALDGQMIGIGAGQQSRIDCTKLAGRKTETWFLRLHPRVLNLPFKNEVKQVERTNARVCFIEGDMTSREIEVWEQYFKQRPDPLSEEEKKSWLDNLQGVSLASDAFFPFRDNIDQAARRGVRHIVQPGASIRDEEIVKAANEYEMVMAFSKIRLFHH